MFTDCLKKNQLPCYYPIEGDATVDVYKLLSGMTGSDTDVVQVSYEGVNRVEWITEGETTKTIVFWGDTAIPISAGRKNDMEDFRIDFNIIAKQIPNAEMRETLENAMRGYTMYIPPNPYM